MDRVRRLPDKLVSFKEQTVALATDRLILRRWRDSDREPFAKINADRQVMEFFPNPLSREESDSLVDQIEAHFQKHEFGLFAAELRTDHTFVGYIGLAVPTFAAAFIPCVEVGWRLSADQWGQGLATEGARELVRFAFGTLKLDSLVSYTVPGNVRSRRVMDKIGMTHDPTEDFEHPNHLKGILCDTMSCIASDVLTGSRRRFPFLPTSRPRSCVTLREITPG